MSIVNLEAGDYIKKEISSSVSNGRPVLNIDFKAGSKLSFGLSFTYESLGWALPFKLESDTIYGEGKFQFE